MFFLCSCGPRVIHSDKLDIGKQWSYGNTLISEYTAQDTSSKYDLALKLIHTKEFEYQNVYLNVATSFPDGVKTTNPLSLDLSTKTGNWLGKCNSKDCEITFSFQDNFSFKTLGKHKFEIGQYSREDQLEGISEIELILFESRKE